MSNLQKIVDGFPADEDYCTRNCWRWEEKVEAILKDKGYTQISWESKDSDSFGPLVRNVTATNSQGEVEKAYYG